MFRKAACCLTFVQKNWSLNVGEIDTYFFPFPRQLRKCGSKCIVTSPENFVNMTRILTVIEEETNTTLICINLIDFGSAGKKIESKSRFQWNWLKSVNLINNWIFGHFSKIHNLLEKITKFWNLKIHFFQFSTPISL